MAVARPRRSAAAVPRRILGWFPPFPAGHNPRAIGQRREISLSPSPSLYPDAAHNSPFPFATIQKPRYNSFHPESVTSAAGFPTTKHPPMHNPASNNSLGPSDPGALPILLWKTDPQERATKKEARKRAALSLR